MLARFRLIEHLLGELAIGVGRAPARVVFEDRGALHGRLRILDGLFDAVLKTRSPSSRISTASRVRKVRRSYIVGRIPTIPTFGFKFSLIIASVFSSWTRLQRQVLALHGHDHAVGGDQCVDGRSLSDGVCR